MATQRKLRELERELKRVDMLKQRLEKVRAGILKQRNVLMQKLKFQPPAPVAPPPTVVTTPPPQIQLPTLTWEEVLYVSQQIAANPTHPKSTQVIDLLTRVDEFTLLAASSTGSAKDEAIRYLELAKSLLTEIARWAVYNGEVSLSATAKSNPGDLPAWLLPAVAVGGIAIWFIKHKKR